MVSVGKGTTREVLDGLDRIFGREYFQHWRLLLTVARDVAGVMKVAHKLQSKLNEAFGAVVEVHMEHVKQEQWLKLHEATITTGTQKGSEVADCQVTHIPEGLREAPYKRDRLPTLEALLLWEDASGKTRSHCMYTIAHPDTPSLDQVDAIFEQISPYFAKRWLIVELRLAAPIRGEFEDDEGPGAAAPTPHDSHVGSGVAVTVLACHAYGFARNETGGGVAGVEQCRPLPFDGTTDDAGSAKICFLPAQTNKVVVAETGRFHGTEVTLPLERVNSLMDGPTVLAVELNPKALASVSVHVFVMPRTLPPADATDGIVDWGAEEREALPAATVEVRGLKDIPSMRLAHSGGSDLFLPKDGGLPEGCVEIAARCDGFVEEEKSVMLFVGDNEFYIPLRRA